MKTAKLEVLEIELPLGKFQEYHDEGFVKNLLEKVRELSAIYRDYRYLFWQEANDLAGGKIPKAGSFSFYTGIWPFKTKHVHIAYENRGQVRDIMARAHEETHVITMFREERLRILEEKIKSDGFNITTNLSDLDSETRANIGGLYALLKRGYSREDIRYALPEYLTRELDFFE